MALWVPPRVERELAEQSRHHAYTVVARSRIDSVCETFNRELRDIDPYLEMRFFDENGASEVTGAVPNRYHLIRRPPVGPPTLIAIHGPDGGYMEPNSSIFQKLREGDLWNSDAVHDRRRSAEAAERAAARQRARENEERQEILRDAYNAAFRTQVSMNRDTPWTQNASANSRRYAASKKKAA